VTPNQPAFDAAGLLTQSGPLSRDTAHAALAQAAAFMANADFLDAARLYQRVVGFNDASVTAAAMIGLGEALYRLDDDASALSQWEAATQLPENEHTYAAWRNVAAARVRAGDLRGAMAAYREADRRAPQQDKAEIASRMGWLSKQLGDTGASGRYFSRARGDVGFSFAIGLVVITTAVSLLADVLPASALTWLPGSPPDLFTVLALDKVLLAAGELYRLWTVTLVHARLNEMPLHLIFNMLLLYQTGPIVERLYGRWAFLGMYLVAAAGGSLASFAFGEAQGGIGASGAVFGLFGILIAALYIHRPVLDQQTRGIMGQLVALVVLNLVIGFAMAGVVDNWAHIGGLVAGLWLGVLFAPTRAPTLRSMWMRPGSTPGTTVPVFGSGGTIVLRVAGLVALGAFFALLWSIGIAVWG
jgi:membrane associated rhomboid family serine protease